MPPIRLALPSLVSSFALLACSQAPDSWRVLSADGEMVAVTDRPRRVEGTADSYTVNLATARFYPERPGQGYDVMAMEVDCPERMIRARRMTSYSDDGSLENSFDTADPKQAVVDGSPGEKLHSAVCEGRYVVDTRFGSLAEFLTDVRSRADR